MVENSLVRVSCSGLVELIAPGSFDGKHYALPTLAGQYSRSKAKKGKLFFSPFGGRNKYDEHGKKSLDDLGVAKYDSSAEQGDIALWLPEDKVGKFADWFYSREGREVVPIREITEEFKEEGLLHDYKEGYCFSNGKVFRKRTQKAGGGEITEYFFD